MSLIRDAHRCLDNHGLHAKCKAFINALNKDTTIGLVQKAQQSPTAGALSGRLVAVKDNICTSDLPTTAGSRILERFKSPYDATVVSKLRQAGAVIVGKTNLDEFGMGSHSTHSHFGSVCQIDPTDGATELSAGGSSGGSAVAVATGQCWAALGTDTGGSVRLPAAYTGVVGFKPSYGRLSRWGVIAYANSLDTVGILAKSSSDARTVFESLDEYDTQDPTSLTPSTRARIATSHLSKRNRKLRIGLPIEYNISELTPSVRNAWLTTLQSLQKSGHSIHPVSLPSTRHALSAYYVLAPAEASSNLAKYDGVRYGTRSPSPDGSPSSVLFAKTRGDGFGEEVKRRILLGAYSLSAEAIDNYFIQAQKVRRLVQRDFDAAFTAANPLLSSNSGSEQSTLNEDGVDVLICPTAPSPPPTIQEVKKQDPLQAYTNDVFTVPASLAGLPALSVPARAEQDGQGENIGMQVIGQFGDDQLVLDVGEMIEHL